MAEIRESKGRGYGQSPVCIWCRLARLWAHMSGHLIMCVYMIVETQSHPRPFPLLLTEARSLSQSLSSLVWWFLFDRLLWGYLFLPPWARSTSRTLRPPATLCEFWNSECQSSHFQGKFESLIHFPQPKAFFLKSPFGYEMGMLSVLRSCIVLVGRYNLQISEDHDSSRRLNFIPYLIFHLSIRFFLYYSVGNIEIANFTNLTTTT